MPILVVCRKARISDATFYSWRKKYAGLMPSEIDQMRQFDEENAGLKRIVADLSDKELLQDVIKRSKEIAEMRTGCFNAQWFMSLSDAQEKVEGLA